MADNQQLANDIGAAVRAAERSVQAGNTGQAIVDLGTLHGLLDKAYLAFNEVADAAGVAALEWGPIASDGAARGDVHTNSGGTPKVAPSAE